MVKIVLTDDQAELLNSATVVGLVDASGRPLALAQRSSLSAEQLEELLRRATSSGPWRTSSDDVGFAPAYGRRWRRATVCWCASTPRPAGWMHRKSSAWQSWCASRVVCAFDIRLTNIVNNTHNPLACSSVYQGC